MDKIEIYRLLNSLYLNNENYKQFLLKNNYNYIKVIKSFHLDVNKLLKSLHFNVIFKNQDKDISKESNIFHIYLDINTNEITSITEVNNIL